ncbi:MAG: hypothetical protein NC918_02665 [Candidatus Omnitrophica bacterium]|nr:hypothetical protein [Candidatus Omnitrophota bacterium]
MNKDKIIKNLLIAIWNEYCREKYALVLPLNKTLCMKTKRLLPYSMIDLAHIKKRSNSPGNKYDLNNVMLLCREAHIEQEKTGDDFRDDEFKKYIIKIMEVLYGNRGIL